METVTLNLGQDAFEVVYDPARVSPQRMIEAIAEAGFKARVATGASAPEPKKPLQLAPDTLPSPLREAFEAARAEGKRVAVRIHGPG